MEIKNLSQFLREADKLKLTMVRHDWYPSGILIGLERTVKKVQTKAIQFMPHKEGSEVSWLHFDNGAAGVRFCNDKFIVDLEGSGSFEKVMVYMIEEK